MVSEQTLSESVGNCTEESVSANFVSVGEVEVAKVTGGASFCGIFKGTAFLELGGIYG